MHKPKTRSLYQLVAAAFLLITIHLNGFGSALIDDSKLREGDIIFQETSSFQGKAIKLATHSRYTHVGIVFSYNGKLMILEAVHPVKITPLDRFIKRGIKQHYVVKRIRDYDTVMTKGVIDKMKEIGKTMIGKKYDLYFEWNDQRIYCTELVWKLYKQAAGIEVGKLQRIKDFDLSHGLVKYMMFKRYGTNVPMDEPVITPQGMFQAENLETVMEKN